MSEFLLGILLNRQWLRKHHELEHLLLQLAEARRSEDQPVADLGEPMDHLVGVGLVSEASHWCALAFSLFKLKDVVHQQEQIRAVHDCHLAGVDAEELVLSFEVEGRSEDLSQEAPSR